MKILMIINDAPYGSEHMDNAFRLASSLASLVEAFCGAAGVFLSFHFDISYAATIMLNSAALFLAVYLAFLACGKKVGADPRARRMKLSWIATRTSLAVQYGILFLLSIVSQVSETAA